MKAMKKISALVLALVMMMAMTVTAFAQNVPALGPGESIDGTKGKITIENALKGGTYKIYKLFDATVANKTGADSGDDAINYTGVIPESLQAYFSKDAAGNITATDAAKDGNEMSGGLMTALKTWAATVDEATAQVEKCEGGTLVFHGLEYGYYVITSDQDEGKAVTVDSTNPYATVVDKNTTDPVHPENPKTVDETVKTIGEDVNYTIQFTGTNYSKNGTKIQTYTVKDTSDDVLIDTDTIQVKVGETVIHNAGDQKDKYDFTYEDGVLTVVINWTEGGAENTDHLYDNGSAVEITYTAEVLKVTSENKVDFEWNQEPFGNGGEVTVHSFDFDLKKISGDETPVDLEGAEFTLEKTNADGEATDIIAFVEKLDAGEKTYTVANSTDTTTTETIVAGNVKIAGLGDGIYILTETKAPDGYNKLTEPLKVVVTDGKFQLLKMDGSVAATIEGKEIAIVNNAGATLPSTGGIGTTIFYVVGGILVAAAVVLLVTKKRMNRA